jgi:hypothetical protein
MLSSSAVGRPSAARHSFDNLIGGGDGIRVGQPSHEGDWVVQEVAVELDPVIVFVAGPEAVAPLLPGFVLDPGISHGGQGTRNRRVFPV